MMIDGIPLDIDGSSWFMELSGDLSKQLQPSHYDSNVGFGTVLSLFYPCFTGTNFSGEFHLEFSGDFFWVNQEDWQKLGIYTM